MLVIGGSWAIRNCAVFAPHPVPSWFSQINHSEDLNVWIKFSYVYPDFWQHSDVNFKQAVLVRLSEGGCVVSKIVPCLRSLCGRGKGACVAS